MIAENIPDGLESGAIQAKMRPVRHIKKQLSYMPYWQFYPPGEEK